MNLVKEFDQKLDVFGIFEPFRIVFRIKTVRLYLVTPLNRATFECQIAYSALIPVLSQRSTHSNERVSSRIQPTGQIMKMALGSI